MTVIHLNEHTKIEIDGYNHTLMKFIPGGKENIRKPGTFTQDRWDTIGYYPNVVATVNKHSRCSFVVFRENSGNGKIVKPLWHFQEPNFEGVGHE